MAKLERQAGAKSGAVVGCSGARDRKRLTFLLGKDNFDNASLELAAIPVVLGILRVPIIEELDKCKRLLLPASEQEQTRAFSSFTHPGSHSSTAHRHRPATIATGLIRNKKNTARM